MALNGNIQLSSLVSLRLSWRGMLLFTSLIQLFLNKTQYLYFSGTSIYGNFYNVFFQLHTCSSCTYPSWSLCPYVRPSHPRCHTLNYSQRHHPLNPPLHLPLSIFQKPKLYAITKLISLYLFTPMYVMCVCLNIAVNIPSNSLILQY